MTAKTVIITGFLTKIYLSFHQENYQVQCHKMLNLIYENVLNILVNKQKSTQDLITKNAF